MKKCYCGFPETYETIQISKNNARCNLCFKQVQKNRIDYSSRLTNLKNFLKKTRNKNMLYDCIVPFSGGCGCAYDIYKVFKNNISCVVCGTLFPFSNTSCIEINSMLTGYIFEGKKLKFD